MHESYPTAVDILTEGKRLFGKWGQKWTRFSMSRPGVCGRNYCSLGAIREASNRLGAGSYVQWEAERYLHRAMGYERIEIFNDGSALFRNKALRVAQLLIEMIPGMGRLRWHFRVKPAWCKAIKLALEDKREQ